MELSHAFGFLKIVKESIKLVPKNGKTMASITILSLLLPSLFLFLLVYFHKFLTKKVENAIMESIRSDSGYTPNQIIMFHLALLLVAGIPCLIGMTVVSYLSKTAVIVVSAMSYTGKKASVADVLARINKNCSSQRSLGTYRRRSRNLSFYLLVAAALAVYLVTFNRKAISSTSAIAVGITVIIQLRYAKVVKSLAFVVSAVEEGCEQRDAVERAQDLVVGHRLQGFMLNMFIISPIWGFLLAYSMALDDKWYLNIAIHCLLFLNSFSLANIFLGVAYTVLYFNCKKHHGEEIDVLAKV